MRQLANKDLFRFIRIIKDAGITKEFKQLMMSKDSFEDVASAGYDIMFMIAEGATKEGVEEQLYEFVGDLIGKTPEDVSNMDPIVTFEQLKQCADLERWKAFFQLGARSMK